MFLRCERCILLKHMLGQNRCCLGRLSLLNLFLCHLLLLLRPHSHNILCNVLPCVLLVSPPSSPETPFPQYSLQCSSLCSSPFSSRALLRPGSERSCRSWQRCQLQCKPSRTRRPPGCRTCAAPPSGCSPAPSRSPPDRCRLYRRPPGLPLLRRPGFP